MRVIAEVQTWEGHTPEALQGMLDNIARLREQGRDVIDDSLVIGWVDHDRDDDRWWLAPDEVNIGYHVFPAHTPSLAVAERNGFERAADVEGRTFWRRPVTEDR